jgi:hypothetical protein
MMTNPFRLDAGPEVDAAWKSLGVDCKLFCFSTSVICHVLTFVPDRAARVPFDVAAQSGLASDQVKIKEKYGGGYPANVEGLHHLHCLNLLRKSLAWNFEHYRKEGLGPFSNDANILKYHVSKFDRNLCQRHMTDTISQRTVLTSYANS